MIRSSLLLSMVVNYGVLLQHCSTVKGFSIDQEPLLSLRLVDVQTKATPISILFLDKKTAIILEGLSWTGNVNASSNSLKYTTFLNEEEVASGSITLPNDPLGLPSSINAGTIAASSVGRISLRVVLNDGSAEEASANITVRAYQQWLTIFPILAAFTSFLLVKLEMEYSLFLAIFIGSCMIKGSFITGFSAIFDTYLVEAVSDSSHVAILFLISMTFVLMKMVEKSGGTNEILRIISPYTTRTRIAQLAIFVCGLVFFFDSYTSILIVGKVLGSILKGFPLSCEKFAFLVDSTALPVASIIPSSSWIVAGARLLQEQIDVVAELDEVEIGTTMETGKSMILASIKYQSYQILLLILILLQLSTGRDAGPLLRAENKERSNFANVEQKMETMLSRGGMRNKQERSWNWWIPVVFLNVLLWLSFARMNGATENEDMYSFLLSLMTSTAATVVLVQIIFFFQTKKAGSLGCCGYHGSVAEERVTFIVNTFSSASTTKSDGEPLSENVESQRRNATLSQVEPDEVKSDAMETEKTTSKTRPLLTLQDGIECVWQGTRSCVPIFLSLIFAWGAGGMYTELGVSRIVVEWILDSNISEEALPIVAYFATLLLSLVLGSAWRTVSLLVPAVTVPLYQSVGGGSDTFIITLAAILSGAVSGDHIGPFSETTILSGLVSGGDVRSHFMTQAPYAVLVVLVGAVTGTLPLAFNAYQDYIGWLLGSIILAIFVVFVCRRVDKPSIDPGRAAEAITQSLHKSTEVGRREDPSAIASPRHYRKQNLGMPASEDPIIPTEERPKQVYPSESEVDTEIMDNRTTISLKSFKGKLREVNEEGRDPIYGLVQSGLLPRNIRSELHSPRRCIPRSGRVIGSTHSEADMASMKTIENKKKLIEATIKKAEKDGNIFSDSLRMFLRTAEKKIDQIMDEESLDLQASESADVSVDDSLDNLMMDIASKDWRSAVDELQDGNRGDPDGSVEGDYTTDGASSAMETDDSASTSSYSAGYDKSTAFTGDGTSFNGDGTSRGTSHGPSVETEDTSRLHSPLEFGKSRKMLPSWLDGEFSVASSHDAGHETKASF